MGAPVKAGVSEHWHWRGKRRTSTWNGTLLDARDNLVGWCCKGAGHRSYGEALQCADRALTARLTWRYQARSR
jgi:hypothetical protein